MILRVRRRLCEGRHFTAVWRYWERQGPIPLPIASSIFSTPRRSPGIPRSLSTRWVSTPRYMRLPKTEKQSWTRIFGASVGIWVRCSWEEIQVQTIQSIELLAKRGALWQPKERYRYSRFRKGLGTKVHRDPFWSVRRRSASQVFLIS